MNYIVISPTRESDIVKPTRKPLSNRPVANETAVSVVHVTFSESLIDCAQVQVDSILIALYNLQVDSIVQVERQSPIFLRHLRTDNVLMSMTFLYYSFYTVLVYSYNVEKLKAIL